MIKSTTSSTKGRHAEAAKKGLISRKTGGHGHQRRVRQDCHFSGGWVWNRKAASGSEKESCRGLSQIGQRSLMIRAKRSLSSPLRSAWTSSWLPRPIPAAMESVSYKRLNHWLLGGVGLGTLAKFRESSSRASSDLIIMRTVKIVWKLSQTWVKIESNWVQNRCFF